MGNLERAICKNEIECIFAERKGLLMGRSDIVRKIYN